MMPGLATMGSRNVGLDVSLKHTSICVVNGTGSVMREGVVDSDPDAIVAFAPWLATPRMADTDRRACRKCRSPRADHMGRAGYPRFAAPVETLAPKLDRLVS